MRNVKAAAFAAVCTLLGSAARAEVVSAFTPDRMAAHYIDVGQGAAVLLEFSCGVALIDVGGQADSNVDGNARLMAYLAGFFARRSDLNGTIDVVFLTHDHADHTSGATVAPKDTRPPIAFVPQTPGLVPPDGAPPPYKIREVITNEETGGSGTVAQQALIAYARGQGIGVKQVKVSDITKPFGLDVSRISCGQTSPVFRLLWGSSHNGQDWQNDGNNQSLVIRLDFGDSSFLFLGDLEDHAHPRLIQAFADNPRILDVDVFHAPHHGSKNGTTPALVSATKPEIAIISAGDPEQPFPGFSAREFGHPNQVVINLLQRPRQGEGPGVTDTRAPKRVAVGISGRAPNGGAPPRYTHTVVRKAIYATGWDGDIVVEADRSGTKTVVVSRP